MADAEKQPEESCRKTLKLYRLLLEKYSELINEREKRTIGEIKSLVNSDDLTVQSVLGDLVEEGYSFERDYPKAAEKAFAFAREEIEFVEPDIPLNYWLSPKELLTEKVGDDEDLALFLCSVLLGLGDENAEVVIAELDDLSTHAFVITELEGRFYILDPSQNHYFDEFSGRKEEVLLKYSFRGSKIRKFLYRFNSKNYEQFFE